jgi:hypothetical protein
MNDIEPWLNGDVPPNIAESLLAARAEAPRRIALERCMAMIGSAGAVGLTASAASAASHGAGKAVGLAAIVKWGLTGVAAGTLLTGGVEMARRMTAPSPMPSAVAASATVRSLPSATHAKPARVVAPPPARSAELPAAHLRAPQVASAPSVDERLAAELALLNDVRAAVDRRDTDSALRLLSEHERRYPSDAQLRPEARYLRLEALELAGRHEEARGVAQRILERDPRGPHAARAKEVLEKE